MVWPWVRLGLGNKIKVSVELVLHLQSTVMSSGTGYWWPLGMVALHSGSSYEWWASQTIVKLIG